MNKNKDPKIALTFGMMVIFLTVSLTDLFSLENSFSTTNEHELETQLQLQFVGFEVDTRLDAQQAQIAHEGLQAMYDGRVFRNGIPQSTFKLLKSLVPKETPAQAFLQSGVLPSPPTRSMGSSSHQIPLDEAYVEREGSRLATRNCFMCHAGANAGMVVAGMANAHVDQTIHYKNYQKLSMAEPILKAVSEVKIFLGYDAPNDRAELENMFHQVDEFLIPTFQYARSRGDNMGPFAVWTYVARMQNPKSHGIKLMPRKATSALTDLLTAERLPTVDPNPWWHRKYKTSSYRYGENSRFRSAHFALNFTNPHPQVNETHRKHVQTIDTVLQFANQTRSPAYPLAINGQLEQRGAALYHGETPLTNGDRLNCHDCHGSYRKTGQYGEVGNWEVDYRETKVRDVGTDSKYVEFLQRMQTLADRTREIADFPGFAGEDEIIPLAEVPTKNGYVSPPLVGAWISAPYFHNGSVPTIEQVLDSTQRPQAWQRSLSPMEYDYEALGMKYTTVNMSLAEYQKHWHTTGQMKGNEGTQFRAIYHTESFGKDNGGHKYGDAMTTEERAAVIEFIKSLSGPNMYPATSTKQET